MKIYMYIDESGSIHPNSNTDYFGVGGYFVLESEKKYVIDTYKKSIKEIRKKRNIAKEKEIKSYNFTNEEKAHILSLVDEASSFYGCSLIFSKNDLKNNIYDVNFFFNFVVKLLIKDYIIPFINELHYNGKVDIYLNVDNRNLEKNHIADLDEYLETEFVLDDIDFYVTYFDSKNNYGVQLADLIINTSYNYYKDKRIVESVISELDNIKYNFNLFTIKTD